jgi:hypothetical protein
VVGGSTLSLTLSKQNPHSFFQDFELARVSLVSRSFAQRTECFDVKHGKTSKTSLHTKHPLLVFKSEQVALLLK